MAHKLLQLVMVICAVIAMVRCAPASVKDSDTDPAPKLAPADVRQPTLSGGASTTDPSTPNTTVTKFTPLSFGDMFCRMRCPLYCAGQDWCCAALECRFDDGHMIGIGTCHCFQSGSYHSCMVCNKRKR